MRAWLTRDKAGILVLWLDYGGGRPARLPIHEDEEQGWMGIDGLVSLPDNHPIGESVTWESGPVEMMIITKDEHKLEHTRMKNKLDAALEELVRERRKYEFLRVDLSCLECLEQFEQGVCDSCYARLALRFQELEKTVRSVAALCQGSNCMDAARVLKSALGDNKFTP